MEEEGVVMPPPPPVLVVDEEVVEEEEAVQQPPPMLEEEEEAVQQPPLVEEAVQPPPLVEEEEEVVVQPPPLVEEEEMVQPPPVMVVDEEGVVQPLVEEEEEGVQEVPAPDPHALHLAQWMAMRLRYAAHYRRRVATELENYVIPRCRRARVTLRQVSAVLLQEEEPIEAAETIYTDLLEDVSRGMNPLLIGPAANFVDTLFNWPGPLAAVTDAARALVHDTFYNPPPEGGPLQEASRELRYLVHVAHAGAAYHFWAYAATLGLYAFPDGRAAYDLWAGNHHQADAQARRALQRLNFAVDRSLAADHAVGLCGIMPASRARPGAGPHMPTAAQRLQQTINAVDDVLVELLDMQDTLMLVEQAVFNITGGQHP